MHRDTFVKEHLGLNIHIMQGHLILSSKYSHLITDSPSLATTPMLIQRRIKSVSLQPIKTLKELRHVSPVLKAFTAQQMESGLLLLHALEELFAPNHLRLQPMDHVK